MRNFLFPTLVSVLFLAGCCKDDDSNPVAGNPIRFDNLTVGQSSRYLGLNGENYFSTSNDDYSYSDDTLVVSIVALDANGFRVKEEMRYVDSVHTALGYEKDSVYYYYLKIENDTLRVAPPGSGYVRSRLFSATAYQGNGLPLQKTAAASVEILGWKTSFPYCECRKEGVAADFDLFGVNYKDLNVIVDDSSMAVDGPGQTYVYAAQYGIVRFTEVSWWTQSGYGWDLLPQ